MKTLTQLILISALTVACSTSALAGGTITNGTASLQFVGTPIFNSPNGDANLTFSGISDQQSRYTWYVRTGVGTNNIFSAVNTPVETYSGNTATITYTNAGPGLVGLSRYDANFTITLTSNASGQAVVNTTLVFTAAATNTSTQTFQLFNVLGFDLGANGLPDTYHVTNSSTVSGTITDGVDVVQFSGNNADRYEFNLGSTLNSEAGSGVSFFANTAGTTASDFANAAGGVGMQFTRTLAPGQSTTITTSYALNVPSPLAPSAVVSRKTHGAAGPFDIAMPVTGPSGVECRSGGATGDYLLVMTFPTSVSVTGNPQAQVTSGMGQIGTGGVSNGGAVSVNGAVVTVPLTNVANAQNLTVTLGSVNNGTNTASVSVPMGVLVGDTNADRAVNSADVGQTKSCTGTTVTAANFREDVTADGSINSSDVGLVKSKCGTALP